MSVMLEFSMYPTGKGESLSKYVSESAKIIVKSGVDYRFGSMGTVLEGEWDEVMDVVSKCYKKMKQNCNRISCHITIDYRNGRTDGLTNKIESVANKLNIKLKT